MQAAVRAENDNKMTLDEEIRRESLVSGMLDSYKALLPSLEDSFRRSHPHFHLIFLFYE